MLRGGVQSLAEQNTGLNRELCSGIKAALVYVVAASGLKV